MSELNKVNQAQWSDPIINSLDELDGTLDKIFPNGDIQNTMDALGHQIKQEFSNLAKFDQWLEENGATDWHEQLATYLVKLPIRSARNVIGALYSVISTALYLSVHPMKGINHLAKEVIILMESLSKPEVWSKIGAGSIGAIAGQSFILGNPISLMGFGIGGALILAGVTVDSLTAAINAEKGKELHATKEKLKHYAAKLPENVLTGFFMGMLIGGIRRAVQGEKPMELKKPDQNVIDLKPGHHEYQLIEDVAQYGHGDWSKVVDTVRGISLDKAFKIADSNPDIDYFFHTKGGQMVLGGAPDGGFRWFNYGDTVFFSGEPWWGSAKDLADGYIKT